MADIFISYLHEEERAAKAVQDFLKRKFEGQQKIFLSSDQWQIYAGEIWLDRIREELDSAKVVVLLLSKRSVGRPWVNFEAGAAWFTKKALIPVCFGNLSKTRLPLPYSGIQALDLPKDAYYLLSSGAHHLNVFAPVPSFKDQDAAFKQLQNGLSNAN